MSYYARPRRTQAAATVSNRELNALASSLGASVSQYVSRNKSRVVPIALVWVLGVMAMHVTSIPFIRETSQDKLKEYVLHGDLVMRILYITVCVCA